MLVTTGHRNSTDPRKTALRNSQTVQYHVDVYILLLPISLAHPACHMFSPFGPNCEPLFRLSYTSPVICVAGPDLAESLAA